MNKQIETAASQPAALEIKGATTMNKVIRNSLTITAFAALALIFGACSQPEVTSTTEAIVPNISAATDTVSDATADTPASAEDLADVIASDSSVGNEPGLQAQGGDRVAPVLFQAFITARVQEMPTSTLADTQNVVHTATLDHPTNVSNSKLYSATLLTTEQPFSFGTDLP